MASFWIRSSIPSRHSTSASNRNHITRHRDLENADSPNHVLNTNEKTPLLRKHDINNYGSSSSSSSSSSYSSSPLSSPTSTSPLLPPPTPTQLPTPKHSIRRLRLRKFLLILLCISLIAPIYHIYKTLFSGCIFNCNPRPPSIPWRYYSQQYVYGLTPASTSDTFTLAVHESLNPAHFPNGGVSGSVTLLTGKRYQSHNLLVFIQVFSLSASPIKSVRSLKIIHPYSSENITITSSPPPPPNQEDEEVLVEERAGEGEGSETNPTARTFVNVYIYTRPQSTRLGHTSISTNTLDITLSPSGAHFETRHLSLTSFHGNISNAFIPTPPITRDPLYASEINLSSLHASITGTWTYGLSFSAAAPNREVFTTLLPAKISWGPGTPGDISIIAGSGINVFMPFLKKDLSLRNGTISMVCYTGDINAHVVSGYHTNITAVQGRILGRVLPYWERWSSDHDEVQVKLITRSKLETSIVVENPVNDGSMWYINPLEYTFARHEAETGSVRVKYPVEFWKGKVEVESVGNKRAEILGVDGNEVPGVVRDGDGKVSLEGQKEGSEVVVRGRDEAVFKFWEGA